MKRMTALLLLVVTCYVGCSKSSEPNLRVVKDDSDTSAGPPQSAAEPLKLSIGFVTNQIADFWKLAEAGCKQAEGESWDVTTVEFRMPAQATAVEQKRIVEDLMTSGIDALAISPIDAENQVEWLNSIAEEIPLVTHDSDAPGSNRLMYIGMDNYAAGQKVGELVKQALPDGGEVLIFIGRLEQDNSKLRRQGVIDSLLGRDRDLEYYRKQPEAFDPADEEVKGNDYVILGTITDTGKPEVAQAKAEDALNSYPDLDAMVGLFEYNPPACLKALEKAGKLGEVKLVGFDENDATLQAIKDGHCEGTVVQNPYMYGYEAITRLQWYIEEIPDSIPESGYLDIPSRVVTQENVDEFWTQLKAMRGQ